MTDTSSEAETSFQQAVEAFNSSNLDLAIDLFKTTVSLSPDHADAYNYLAVCRTMKLSIHRGKELLAFKITCSNSFLPILFFLNESTGWNKRDGALKCAYTLIQTRHNRIFSTWFTQYMHPF